MAFWEKKKTKNTIHSQMDRCDYCRISVVVWVAMSFIAHPPKLRLPSLFFPIIPWRKKMNERKLSTVLKSYLKLQEKGKKKSFRWNSGQPSIDKDNTESESLRRLFGSWAKENIFSQSEKFAVSLPGIRFIPSPAITNLIWSFTRVG